MPTCKSKLENHVMTTAQLLYIKERMEVYFRNEGYVAFIPGTDKIEFFDGPPKNLDYASITYMDIVKSLNKLSESEQN